MSAPSAKGSWYSEWPHTFKARITPRKLDPICLEPGTGIFESSGPALAPTLSPLAASVLSSDHAQVLLVVP